MPKFFFFLPDEKFSPQNMILRYLSKENSFDALKAKGDKKVKESISKKLNDKLIIKKCHVCGHVNEAIKELERCGQCKKAFLPLNYFLKIHEKSDNEPYKNLFAASHQLDEEDLIHGIYVLW